MEELKTIDNSKLFRKIVRDYNEKYGFKFKLPKDTDYTSEYAHPVHEDATFKITSQISEDYEGIYALRVKFDDFLSFRIEKDFTYEQLKKGMDSESFKYRMGTLRQLRKLARELSDKTTLLEHSLFDEVITDLEREENYDLAILTAKELYRSK